MGKTLRQWGTFVCESFLTTTTTARRRSTSSVQTLVMSTSVACASAASRTRCSVGVFMNSLPAYHLPELPDIMGALMIAWTVSSCSYLTLAWGSDVVER